jgi:Fic family protein
MAIQYQVPASWLQYKIVEIIPELTEAKAAVLSLTAMPFQRSWAEKLQALELRREVAGTSKIEGADFTDREFEDAVLGTTPEELLTRSQKQARAAHNTYSWIATLPTDRSVDDELIKEIHRRVVSGCDDDHCAPGQLRSSGQNVVFGRPRHRGVEGGIDCERAFKNLMQALKTEFRAHDSLIQALAIHYHLGAMHLFQDGNGRTARAVEALMLRRAQLKDTLFVAMSNYYYDEKDAYLDCLSKVRESNFDLTPFLKFGLKGLAAQCHRLLGEIKRHVAKSLYRDVMAQMYGRLLSSRKRALATRQLAILQKLLDKDQEQTLADLRDMLHPHYAKLGEPYRAFIRDLNHLLGLRAITAAKQGDSYSISIRLDWATEITETQFYQEMSKLPEAKTRLLINPSA